MTSAAIAWVLILYVGSHEGYVTVPGLASEEACEALRVTAEKGGLKAAWGGWYTCLPYEPARSLP